MEIPRCATRAIRGSPTREFHLDSETEAPRPQPSSAALWPDSMPVPGQPRSALTSTPAAKAWAHTLSRVGEAPPPSVCPSSPSATCHDDFDGDAMRWHTPGIRQHQISATAARWHADHWYPSGGKED